MNCDLILSARLFCFPGAPCPEGRGRGTRENGGASDRRSPLRRVGPGEPPPEEMLDIVHGGIRLRSNELVGVSKSCLEERLGNLAVQAPMDPGDVSESQDCVPSNIEPGSCTSELD